MQNDGVPGFTQKIFSLAVQNSGVIPQMRNLGDFGQSTELSIVGGCNKSFCEACSDSKMSCCSSIDVLHQEICYCCSNR